MSSSEPTQLEAGAIRYNGHFITSPSLAMFDPTQPDLQAQAVTQGGRNAAWFVQLNGYSAVLRHYRRGGLVAKLVRNYYFWLGAQRTRSWSEYAVLLHLYNKGVAVPQPIAALWQRRFCYYKAAIVVARIPDAWPIAHRLEHCDPKSVALAVKQMHDAGVWHADLNVFNVLIDVQQRIYLIDFDRATVSDVVEKTQRLNNVLRLKRSLIKVRGEAGLQWYDQFAEAYLQLTDT